MLLLLYNVRETNGTMRRPHRGNRSKEKKKMVFFSAMNNATFPRAGYILMYYNIIYVYFFLLIQCKIIPKSR